MLEEVKLYVFDKYIKGMIKEENGEQIIFRDDIDTLDIPQQEKNFIMYIISERKIKLIEKKITKDDRSPYVRDHDYGDIQGHGLQRFDEPVMSQIEYSDANEKVSEEYEKLDEYLEKRFIPTYILLKERKNKQTGEIERYLSIRLHHITALKLSEAEFEHVMNYLKKKNIRVGGKDSTLDKEFDNYDYVTTYKDGALPESVSSPATFEKIVRYRESDDPKIKEKLREEIITDNMRLVPFITYRYVIATGLDEHELESYGYEGLIVALDNFDVNYGCAFSTYAVAYIRGYVQRGIQYMTMGKRDNFYYDYINAKNAVEKENGITLAEAPDLIEDVIELLVATGKIKDDENDIKYARTRIISLEIGSQNLDDEETLEELISTGELVDSHDYTTNIFGQMSKDTINDVLDSLTEREQLVLRLLYGLNDGETKTLDEVAKILGDNVTRERVRQIEKKALRKMRHPSRAKYMRPYYEDAETEVYSHFSRK